MASPIRSEFLSLLEGEFGRLQRIGTSSSLFAIREKARVYVRYSKIHKRGSTFFGLRQADIALLEGFPSFIAFLWEGQTEPLLMPFEQFAPVFQSIEPASDGQYKVHIYTNDEGDRASYRTSRKVWRRFVLRSSRTPRCSRRRRPTSADGLLTSPDADNCGLDREFNWPRRIYTNE